MMLATRRGDRAVVSFTIRIYSGAEITPLVHCVSHCRTNNSHPVLHVSSLFTHALRRPLATLVARPTQSNRDELNLT